MTRITTMVWSVTWMESDILECEVNWALGSITMNKASGGDGIPPELFQILKDDAIQVLHSICQQSWKTQQWPQDWKRLVSFKSQRRAMPKNVPITAQLHSFHMLARLFSKSSKLGFNSTWNKNFDVYKLDFKKTGTRDHIANIHWSQKKQENCRKTSTSASLTTLKPLTMWVTQTVEKFWKSCEYQTTSPVCCETCMQVKKQQSEPDMEQWTGFKLGKSMSRLCTVTLLI